MTKWAHLWKSMVLVFGVMGWLCKFSNKHTSYSEYYLALIIIIETENSMQPLDIVLGQMRIPLIII